MEERAPGEPLSMLAYVAFTALSIALHFFAAVCLLISLVLCCVGFPLQGAIGVAFGLGMIASAVGVDTLTVDSPHREENTYIGQLGQNLTLFSSSYQPADVLDDAASETASLSGGIV